MEKTVHEFAWNLELMRLQSRIEYPIQQAVAPHSDDPTPPVSGATDKSPAPESQSAGVGPRECVAASVQDVAFGGKGVARVGGRVLFIPDVITGEQVSVAISRAHKRFAEAELIKVETPSPHRAVPACPYFGSCGGCVYQHIEYSYQLELKREQVRQVVKRIGKLEVPVESSVAAGDSYGYRNRIRVHLRDGRVGFIHRNQRDIVDIERCWIASPEVNERYAELRLQRMTLPEGQYLIAEREMPFFEQTNDAVAQAVMQSVQASLFPGVDVVVDAYCGAGFFAFGLAPFVRKVIGIEENRAAIRSAQLRATAGMEFLAGDVAAEIGGVLSRVDPERTLLVCDPPAAGMAPRVLEMIGSFAPRRVVYVSCDPSTLARDLKELSSRYDVSRVTPFDMFPQTAGIECVVILDKR